jgi:hypothetical protein
MKGEITPALLKKIVLPNLRFICEIRENPRAIFFSQIHADFADMVQILFKK